MDHRQLGLTLIIALSIPSPRAGAVLGHCESAATPGLHLAKAPVAGVRVISNEVDTRVLEEALAANRSPDVVPFKGIVGALNRDQAVRGVAQIRRAIEEAQGFVRQRNLKGACARLSKPRVLENTGFSFAAAKIELDVDKIGGSSERAFADNFVAAYAKAPPSVSAAGVVTLPPFPRLGEDAERNAWAQREWLRASVYTLTHVAQILGSRVGGRHLLQSRLFNDDFHQGLKDDVRAEGERLNHERARKAGPGAWTRVAYVAEADAYAFLIETFGISFVPAWWGKDSGISVLELVDRELAGRAIPHRDWDGL